MKKIITLSMLFVCLTMQQTMHAYYFSPDELGGGNPALREAMNKDPVTALLLVCCPIYTLFGLELMVRVAEKAPSYERVQKAIAAYDCCKRIEIARVNFIEAHDKGLLALLTSKPKQIKMKDE